MILQARHYRTGQAIQIEYQQTIESLQPLVGTTPESLPWITPAFTDIQINGALGYSFNSEELRQEHIYQVVAECERHGIGNFLPTLVTNSFEAIQHGLQTLASLYYSDRSLAQRIAGFHLEGPYFSAEQGPRGAHPLRHIRDANWEEFCRWQESAQGLIRLVTLAPERDSCRLIERLTKSGVVVAIGHTAASGRRIQDAIRAGAKLSTHLGNGCHAMLPRHDNYIWEQLAADELWASVIADGHHLPNAILKCITRMKTPERLILTCDASSLAGLPPGRYREWDCEFEIQENGKIVVPGTPFFAGSGQFTDTCVGHIANVTDITLAEAVEMATRQPRKLLGLPPRTLEVGQPAQFILFDWQPGDNLVIRQTVL